MATSRSKLVSQLRAGGMTRVNGSRDVYLLPTRTGQGGKVFRRGGMEFTIASLAGVQQEVSEAVREAYSRAWGHLGTIRAAAAKFGITDEWVNLEARRGRIDRYLVLIDTKGGHKGAMSIEYGRDEYEAERPDGTTYKVGAMTGKFILHKAFGARKGELEGTGGGDIE